MTTLNPNVGLILKTEPEMAGIFRWAKDLLDTLQGVYPISRHEVSSPNSFLFKYGMYPLGRALGKDIRTAYRNYPRFFENKDHLKPKLWHIGSQTFGGILETLHEPSIITVFDLYPLIFNTFGSDKDRTGYMRAIEHIPSADFILTLSHSAKNEIVHSLGVSPRKVTVIPAGIGSYFSPRNVERDPYNIVYVGSELPRKNLNRLFEALSYVFKEVPHAHFTKVGRPQWAGTRKELQELATKYGIADNVTFLDYVEDLATLYSSSGVSVQISTHEGFGYPVVEAMACGIPTVISKIPSLIELSDGNSVEVDPFEPKDIAQGIIEVLISESLQKNLIEKGLKRRNAFSFEAWRDQMTAYYDSVIREIGL